MIRNKVVTFGTTLNVPGHLSLGQYFLERIIENCAREGDKIALINGSTGGKQKYSEILQDIVNIAVGLKKWGLKRGDVVAVYSESRNEVIPAVMASICCGAAVTMFNLMYTKDELEHVLRISKPRIVFCSSSAIEAQLNTLKDTKSIEAIVQINDNCMTDGVIGLCEVTSQGDPYTYEPEKVCGATDTALILYSSGTTGMPKGVKLTHLSILYVCAFFNDGFTREHCPTIFSILPWYHVFGLLTAVFNLTFHKEFIYLTAFKADKFLNAIQEYRASCALLVPPLVVFLAKSPLVEQYDVSSIKCIWCGAAPLSKKTMGEAFSRLPNFEQLVEGYGLTETTLSVINTIDKLGAEPGMVPVPGNKIKVVDLGTGEKLGAHEQGEIRIKGPTLMKGYVDDEVATKAAIDEEGYLKTGDIGYYDDKGRFYIIDRLKEVIKYKGHQVAPAAIENVILQHSGVADCGVVGKPDEEAVELPTAFVVLKPGVELTEQELLDFTTPKLSPLSRIRGGIIFVDEIPKSQAGKILRRILKQRLLEQSASS